MSGRGGAEARFCTIGVVFRSKVNTLARRFAVLLLLEKLRRWTETELRMIVAYYLLSCEKNDLR